MLRTGRRSNVDHRTKLVRHDLTTDIVHTYGYDNASRVTSFNTTGDAPANRGYGYDAAGQLMSKTGGTAESYTYDDNGNRVTVGSQSIVTDTYNRLTNDGTYSYTYDNEGNLIRRTPLEDISAGNPVTNYVFDHLNRLAAVRQYASLADATANNGSGQNPIGSIGYTYDAQGRRVKRTLDANGAAAGGISNEYFVYDGDELAMRFGNAGELTHRYLYGPAVDQVLAEETFKTVGSQRVTDEVLWLLADQQGTIRDVADDNAVLRNHVDYDSFGNNYGFGGSLFAGQSYYDASGQLIEGMDPWTHPDAVAVDQLFGYTGQEWDEGAKLYNYNARWYDAAIGRFLSEEPSGLDGGDANLYRYVGNRVTYRTDPTGLVQAGNPLNSLFGGYSGNVVSPYQPISPALAAGGSPLVDLVNSGFHLQSKTTLPSLQTSVSPNFLAQSILSPSPFSNSGLPTALGSIAPLANSYFGSGNLSRAGFYEANDYFFESNLSLARSYDYRQLAAPTSAQLLDAELNPHGPAVSVQYIGSPPLGDRYRSIGAGLQNIVQTTNSPLEAGVAQFLKPILGTAGNFAGGLVDAVVARGNPSPLVTYRDGSQGYFMGEGAPTSDYANFLLLAAPPILSGASRPAGTLSLRTASTPTTIAPSSGRGIWDLTPEIRWTTVEQRLGKNLPANYPVIDKFDIGIATSIKSLDLGAPTYSNPAAITRVGSGYVDKLAGFQGRNYARVNIRASQITGRSLDLAVPPGATAAQKQALQEVVTYGRQKGVAVNIVETR